MGSGRSDWPNQVNNVSCFPCIFRAALDVRASVINEQMKIAAARSLADLAKEPVPQEAVSYTHLRRSQVRRQKKGMAGARRLFPGL